MKKIIAIITVAFMSCYAGALAQDVIVLHMKDGTTRRYVNGVKERTDINFYKHAPTTTYTPDYTSTHDNGYQVAWNVNSVWKIDGEYTVGIFWEDSVPKNFTPRHGLCFGTKPGLTVDNCEQKAYAEDVTLRGINIHRDMMSNIFPYCHYLVIGEKMTNNMSMRVPYNNSDSYAEFYLDVSSNHLATHLERGATYYYRTFTEGQVLEDGAMKSVVFYGPERSFRVPRVMADYGYFPYAQGTPEAMAAFAHHFPQGVTAPTWAEIDALWKQWRETAEGKHLDLSADITSDQFDDGTGYRLNRIPDEFYTWLANREVVIDAFDDLAEVSWVIEAHGDTLATVSIELVTGLDSIPGGKYVRFTPVVPTVNHQVIYRSNEVVPGVKYKLVVNFAPETLPNATVNDLLPTLIRIVTNPIEGGKDTVIVNKHYVPATHMSTYENDDFNIRQMGTNLKIESRITSAELRNNNYNRIMRIAQMRLVPYKEE